MYNLIFKNEPDFFFFLDKNMLKKSFLLFVMNSNSATFFFFFSLGLHSKITSRDAYHLYVSSARKLNCKKVECLLGRKSCGLLR